MNFLFVLKTPNILIANHSHILFLSIIVKEHSVWHCRKSHDVIAPTPWGLCSHQTGVWPVLAASPAERVDIGSVARMKLYVLLQHPMLTHAHSMIHIKRCTLFRDQVNISSWCQSIFHYKKSVQLRNISLLMGVLTAHEEHRGRHLDSCFQEFLRFVKFH